VRESEGRGRRISLGGIGVVFDLEGKGRLSHARLRELARSTVSSRRGERGEESGEGGARGGKRRRRRDESEGEKTSPKTKGPGSRRPAKRFSSVGGGGPGRRGRATRLFLARRPFLSLRSRSRETSLLPVYVGRRPPPLSLSRTRENSELAGRSKGGKISLSLSRGLVPFCLFSQVEVGQGEEARKKKQIEPLSLDRLP